MYLPSRDGALASDGLAASFSYFRIVTGRRSASPSSSCSTGFRRFTLCFLLHFSSSVTTNGTTANPNPAAVSFNSIPAAKHAAKMIKRRAMSVVEIKKEMLSFCQNNTREYEVKSESGMNIRVETLFQISLAISSLTGINQDATSHGMMPPHRAWFGDLWECMCFLLC